ncbi:hypothetical protein PV728_43195, partial [Streptomyces europaeiscabiei]|nr:hypothetical protein [Streptomyces europaeiscabiei]
SRAPRPGFPATHQINGPPGRRRPGTPRRHEHRTASSEAMIHIASIDNLARRITDETTPTWRGTY